MDRPNPVRRARARRLWSVQKLAALAGVSPTTIWRAERGKPIGILAKERIAQALGVDAETLFEDAP